MMTPDDSQYTHNDVRAFFDGLAGGWSERYIIDPAMEARLGRFTNALVGRVPVGEAVLDFGCGAGVITRWLAEQGYAMTGCDISSEMVQEARSTVVDGSIRFDICDASLPYPDGTFTAVVSSSVLEYVDDLDSIFAELRRVITPGGLLLVTVPDIRHPHRRKEALRRALLRLPFFGTWIKRSRWAEGAAYLQLSCNRISPWAWQNLLQAHSFKIESMDACEGPLLLLKAQLVSE